MRTLLHLALLLCVALGGCNWSNEDLVFLNALPARERLEASVPSNGTASQGLGQRRDGLTLQGPSTTYARTQKAADDLNGGLLKLLVLVEEVRKLSPSRRTKDSRTWGPYEDHHDKDREARLVITRATTDAGVEYRWSIDVKKKVDAEWSSPISGTYLANDSDDVTRGVGTVKLDAAGHRSRGFAGPGDDPTLQSMAVSYATDADPVMVDVDFEFRREDFFGFVEEWQLHYKSTEFAEGSGSLQFDIVGDVHKVTEAKERLTYLSRWGKDGAGRADITAIEGDFGTTPIRAGAECWDAQFRTVFGFEATDVDIDENGVKAEGPMGSEAACAFETP